MVAYPYTGSGYGAAGVPYAGDRFGQAFKQTAVSDIVETAAAVPLFSTLVSLLKETGLDYELAKGGPFTVLAPTDSAFVSLLEPHGFSILGGLLRPENRQELRKVLAYHVVKGNLSSGALAAAGSITTETFAGEPITLMGYNKKLSAGSARIIKTDVPCSNGVIHVIGSVLIPSSFTPQPTGPVTKSFPSSLVLDVYGKLIQPRQALGIDPLPGSASSSALTI
ncbi:Fasciclin [Gracilaria domingensis]|nr:Fasciclin [Gracilaria domingensis]